MPDKYPQESQGRAGLWAVLVLCAVPFLAHLAELSGLADTNPLLFVSSLARFPGSAILQGNPFVDGNAGQTTLALGHLAAEDWLHGRLPWWNPYTGVGMPLASEMQPAAFFLPFVLLLHFKSGVLFIKIAVQVAAGLAMFGFLRAINLVAWAALLGAMVFELNGTFAWYADSPVFPIAFLPLLLWALERAHHRAAARLAGGEAMIGLAIGFSLLAGFPETAFIDGLMGLAWCALRLAALDRRPGLAFARKVAVGGVLGLALAAPVLVPFLVDLGSSTLGMHDASAASRLGAKHAAAFLFPYVFGPIWANSDFPFWIQAGGYFGLAVPCLAVLALFRRGGHQHANLPGLRLFFGAWALVALCTMFHVPVITWAIRAIPGLRDTQISRYALPSVELAICVLAAVALDDHAGPLKRPITRQQAAWVSAIAVAGFILALNRLAHGSGDFPGFATASLLWGAVSLAGIMVLLNLRPSARQRSLLGALLLIDAACLFAVPTLSGLRKTQTISGPIAFLQANQGLARVVSVNQALFPNAGALFGLGAVHYEYIPAPLLWADYVHSHLDPMAWPNSWPGLWETPWTLALDISDRFRAFETIGVKYVLAPSALKMFGLVFGPGAPHRVYQADGYDIFELSGARPYAEAGGGACNLVVADRYAMHATCTAPATLLRRELFFPGWRAQVNGVDAPVSLGADIFQSIPLPAGESRIEFQYRPRFSRMVWVVFLCGLGWCLLAAAQGSKAFFFEKKKQKTFAPAAG